MLSIPLFRAEIKSSVTAEQNAWLLGIRESSPLVGRLALRHMEVRAKKWKAKVERDGNVKQVRIGSAIELVNNEKSECAFRVWREGDRKLIDMPQSILSITSTFLSTSNRCCNVSIFMTPCSAVQSYSRLTKPIVR